MYKKIILSVNVFLVLLMLSLEALQAQDISSKFSKITELEGIEEYEYQPNGLKVLLVQDNSAPVVTVQVVYKVGSKHEVPGNTGSTHLLEHLNFKGTPTFNKKQGNAIFTVLQGIGAQMNATTWNDRTNYYETIPSDHLELALHIEADRMRNSLLLKEDKEAEMTVVRNEFERGENSPSSLLSKEIWATAYKAHPYHHSTIGWRSDIENMPIEVLRDFYDTYYWPNNAYLTIIGDFEKNNLFSLIDTYFGEITKAPHTIPQPYTEEPEQWGPRSVMVKKPGQQSMINIAYKIPGRLHEDYPALVVLGELMGSGPSSFINKEFVDTGIALYGYASPSSFQEVGLFMVSLGFNPEKDADSLKMKMLNLIDTIKKEGVQQSDVDRISSKLTAQAILARDGSGRIAGELTEAIAGGDWKEYINFEKKLKQVTAEAVQQAAKIYLIEDQSTTGYFIPKNEETVSAEANAATSGKNYFRTPRQDEFKDSDIRISKASLVKTYAEYTAAKNIQDAKKYNRDAVAGIDVVTVKTEAKDFLTVSASMPIDAYINSGKNEMIPSLTTGMLSKGTLNNDKFQLSQKLEKLGVRIGIWSGGNTINISFKCLKKDLPEVLTLLADELRNPLFDEKEFNLLKDQIAGGIKRSLTDPGSQGSIALLQGIYPEGHPNYSKSTEATLKDLESASLSDIKEFHKTYFGPAGMHLVAVGDVDQQVLYNSLEKAFENWKGGITSDQQEFENAKVAARTQVVTIPQKPSAELYIGQYTGLKRLDQDYLPFYVGVNILGGGFSARLMQTVRDDQGLTYNISAYHTGLEAGGHWVINASFNPELFEKGLEATQIQLRDWVTNGVTADELAVQKANLKGSYKVGLATTTGLAGSILNFLERGQTPDYLDQYPLEIDAITLEEVNTAIKNYVDLDKLIIIKSGSLDQESKPLPLN